VLRECPVQLLAKTDSANLNGSILLTVRMNGLWSSPADRLTLLP